MNTLGIEYIYDNVYFNESKAIILGEAGSLSYTNNIK